MAALCASLFTIKKGGGREKRVGDFIGDFYKGAPVCPGIPTLEKYALQACCVNMYVFCATTL